MVKTLICPVFRIFDYDKAVEFYIDWLGFKVDWEDKPKDSPVYLQVSISDIVLHLSEHYGDATPGSRVNIENFRGLRKYQQKLLAKNYQYMKPGIGKAPWNDEIFLMEVIDPFGNRLTFTGK